MSAAARTMLAAPAWGLLDESVLCGDCVETMRSLPEASVDAVVCDPPYGLEFMGRAWDRLDGAVIRDPAIERGGFQDGNGGNPYSRSRIEYGRNAPRAMQDWHEAWAREALRVLKPGGHLLAFGGTRTYHRLAAGIEDAGFEVRDCIAWMHGSGFPKSLDVSKAIDKAAGAERPVVSQRTKAGMGSETTFAQDAWTQANRGPIVLDVTMPATPDAERWQGWGTALKPAFEPIIVARKPLAGTVARNVLFYGTGALNVDDCRVGADGGTAFAGEGGNAESTVTAAGAGLNGQASEVVPGLGRWPANVVMDPEAGALLDDQASERGIHGAGQAREDPGPGPYDGSTGIGFGAIGTTGRGFRIGDSGGASRFFYCAKASSGERNAGLAGFDERHADFGGNGRVGAGFNEVVHGKAPTHRNAHPTVKPIDLMRWLVRLVTPLRGVVLDPFAGSGTTGVATELEGFDFIGIERELEYAAIARARFAWWGRFDPGTDTAAALGEGRSADERTAAGQMVLGL